MVSVMQPEGVASATHAALVHDDRAIGAILVRCGRLDPDTVESIVELQGKWGLRFGEAAIRLNLISQADIEFALSRQFDSPYLLRGQSEVSEELVAAYDPFKPEVEALRAIRGQLLLKWFDTDPSHRTLAIISAERNEGRSYTAANLAIVFSQLGLRTLLVDADLRNPSQHRFFGLGSPTGLSQVLTGRGGRSPIHRIPDMPDLSVLPAGVQPPNPSELLARPRFERLLTELGKDFHIIILDTPAAAGATDAQIASRCAGAAMMVVRKNLSRYKLVQRTAEKVAQTGASLVGSVFSDF